MKLFLRIIGIAFAVLLVALVSFLVYFNQTFPKVSPPKAIQVAITPERLERGKYLANHVAVCIDCHSTRNWDYFSGPPIVGTEGKGGELFNEDAGLPGSIYAKNITPAGVGNWSDGELKRSITTGVSKDGNALFPIMPYPLYSTMDEEDVDAIIAYLRELKPISNQVPQSHLDFPMNLIVKTIPKDAESHKKPSPSDSVAYGKYLYTIAGCGECHTPLVKQNGPPQKMPGMDNAGGYEFRVPWGLLRSSNITPDSTGIGKWTREQFIGKFKTYATEEGKRMVRKPPYNKSYYNSLMPWTMYAGMNESDISSIYQYLNTFKPVHHVVDKYSDEGLVMKSPSK